MPRRLPGPYVPSSSRTNTTKKAKATTAPTVLALVRRRNCRRARASDAVEWLAYARDSDRRKARPSEALGGVVEAEAEEGALPDEMERECEEEEEPLPVEGAFMVSVCALLLVLGALLPMVVVVVVSPANVRA